MQIPSIKSPPPIPLPDPLENPQWYGEVWIRYPLQRVPANYYFAHIFKANSQLRVIMNDICQASFGHGSQFAFEKAKELHSRLEAWYHQLPRCLSPHNIVLPGHYFLQ